MNTTSATKAGNGKRRNTNAAKDKLEKPERTTSVVEGEDGVEESLPLPEAVGEFCTS